MTPEQIWFRLCNIDNLKEARIRPISEAPVMPDSQGRIKGRAADGTELRLPINIGGKSLAARLAEEARGQQKKERRRRRGS